MSIVFPKIIIGTSFLGNLYIDLGIDTKKDIIKSIINSIPDETIMFDSAGKYGAGLSLETLGIILKEIGVSSDRVIISNKLGWRRCPLVAPHFKPTFESNIWVNIEYDAMQDISRDGIIACFNEGNQLLGDYKATTVSVHDPDEYLAGAINENDFIKRRQDILDAYQTLIELKQRGEVNNIGVGSKNIAIIDYISDHVKLDWAMIACSFTIHSDHS
jgi:D-threo-aldose 1-dehydrogenase